jgi:acylphosphatase
MIIAARSFQRLLNILNLQQEGKPLVETTVTRARFRVVGRVQGVCFRQWTQEQAQALGLAGWVRNEMDGSVCVEALGWRQDVEALIKWCHQGPPSARVLRVEVEWLTVDQALSPAEHFEIRY